MNWLEQDGIEASQCMQYSLEQDGIEASQCMQVGHDPISANHDAIVGKVKVWVICGKQICYS